jgi:heptaprenyl diphosphate synthase
MERKEETVYKVALLVSLACVLQMSESLIPHPIPGLRLGLANLITLIALVTMGFGPAIEVTVLRTILSSLIMGTFMSPVFILSFTAGLISTLVMGFLYWASSLHKQYRLSIVGISIASALAHNMVQLYLAYLLLVKHPGIFVFFPWLCIGALFMGCLTGIAAGKICLKLQEIQGQEILGEKREKDYRALTLNNYQPGKSLIHRLSAEVKIVGVIAISLIVLFCADFWCYSGIFLFLIISAAISKSSFGFILSRARRYAPLIFVSFLFPVFFNSGRHVLSQIGNFKITGAGPGQGALFAARILLVLMASLLLVRTTAPEKLSSGIARLLLPLRPLGISGKRTAAILSLSWMTIPVFWEMARNAIGAADLKRIRNLRNLDLFLSDIVTGLYLEAGQIGEYQYTDIARSDGADKIRANRFTRGRRTTLWERLIKAGFKK